MEMALPRAIHHGAPDRPEGGGHRVASAHDQLHGVSAIEEGQLPPGGLVWLRGAKSIHAEVLEALLMSGGDSREEEDVCRGHEDVPDPRTLAVFVPRCGGEKEDVFWLQGAGVASARWIRGRAVRGS